MNFTDEQVMAYVDGELEPRTAEMLERTIDASPDLARRIAAQRALRGRLQQAFEPVLEEPVPARLLRAAAGDRIARLAGRQVRRPAGTAWLAGLAAAAGLVLGVALAPSLTRLGGEQPDIVSGPAGPVAGGELASALSARLAADPSTDSPIHLGASFLAKSGDYCRTFILGRTGQGVSGLACRQSGNWMLQVLAATPNAPGESTAYRQAGTAMSPLVLEAAQAAMAGDALDAQGEEAARRHDWQGPATAP